MKIWRAEPDLAAVGAMLPGTMAQHLDIVVTEIGENFITVEVADNVRLRIQKGAIANVLPKGTLKSA